MLTTQEVSPVADSASAAAGAAGGGAAGGGGGGGGGVSTPPVAAATADNVSDDVVSDCTTVPAATSSVLTQYCCSAALPTTVPAATTSVCCERKREKQSVCTADCTTVPAATEGPSSTNTATNTISSSAHQTRGSMNELHTSNNGDGECECECECEDANSKEFLVRTVLVEAVRPGDTRIHVGSLEIRLGHEVVRIQQQHVRRGLEVGMRLVIGSGAEAEARVISAFGSIILDAPLLHSHSVGCLVRAYKASPALASAISSAGDASGNACSSHLPLSGAPSDALCAESDEFPVRGAGSDVRGTDYRRESELGTTSCDAVLGECSPNSEVGMRNAAATAATAATATTTTDTDTAMKASMNASMNASRVVMNLDLDGDLDDDDSNDDDSNDDDDNNNSSSSSSSSNMQDKDEDGQLDMDISDITGETHSLDDSGSFLSASRSSLANAPLAIPINRENDRDNDRENDRENDRDGDRESGTGGGTRQHGLEIGQGNKQSNGQSNGQSNRQTPSTLAISAETAKGKSHDSRTPVNANSLPAASTVRTVRARAGRDGATDRSESGTTPSTPSPSKLAKREYPSDLKLHSPKLQRAALEFELSHAHAHSHSRAHASSTVSAAVAPVTGPARTTPEERPRFRSSLLSPSVVVPYKLRRPSDRRTVDTCTDRKTADHHTDLSSSGIEEEAALLTPLEPLGEGGGGRYSAGRTSMSMIPSTPSHVTDVPASTDSPLPATAYAPTATAPPPECG